MTKREILDNLKKTWETCKQNEKNRVESPYTHAYNYGIVMESVRHILHTEEVWKDDPESA